MGAREEAKGGTVRALPVKQAASVKCWPVHRQTSL